MGADLHVEAVFERGDDPAATGVVLGVGAGDNDDIKRQPDLEPFDLHVFLFHQIEQSDLDLFGQIRQFIDGKEAAVGAGNETVMDGLLVSQVAPLGHLDGINLTD